MATGERVDVLRAVQQPGYAARFTDEQWLDLVRDPLWGELVGEMPEAVAPLVARYGARIPGFARVLTQDDGGAAESEFKVIGKSRPRVQGLGIVTGTGRYVQNMSVPGMLFM